MSREHELDDVLDRALSEYAQAEPLAGIEERVLRRLEAQPEARRTAWGQWAFAAAGIAIIGIALWFAWRSPGRSVPTAMSKTPIAVGPSVETKAPGGGNDAGRDTTRPYRAVPVQGRSASQKHPVPWLASLPRVPPRPTVLSKIGDFVPPYAQAPAPITHNESALVALAQAHPEVLQSMIPEGQRITIAPIDVQPLPSQHDPQGDQ